MQNAMISHNLDDIAQVTHPYSAHDSYIPTTTHLLALSITTTAALCVNNAFTYIKIIDKSRQNKVFILLEKRLCQLFPEVSKADCTDERKAELFEVVERMTGDKLVGLKYTPLFGYFSEYTDRAFRVICDNYVTEEGGTGIVHQAPAFGEDDYRVCLLHGIVSKGEDLPCPVDANGRFTTDVPEFKGESLSGYLSDWVERLGSVRIGEKRER